MKKILTTILLFFITILSFGQTSVSSGWQPSDGVGTPSYGKGLFYFNIYKDNYPDNLGYYTYYISFISASYHNLSTYGSEIYRTQTIIDNMYITVYNQKVINQLFGSTDFWILFYGNINNGQGYIGVKFKHKNPNLRWGQIKLHYTEPKPY